MPSVIDVMSLISSTLRIVKQIKSVLAKTKSKKLNENTARELYEYVSELFDAINDLKNYTNIIEPMYPDLWSQTLKNIASYLSEKLNGNAGIVVIDFGDYKPEFANDEEFKYLFNDWLNFIDEQLSGIFKHLEKQISSGKLDITADVKSVEPQILEKISAFVSFYREATQWFEENKNVLYHYTTLTLGDALDYKNEMRKYFDKLNEMMKILLHYIDGFKMTDLIDNAMVLKNMLSVISDVPNILTLAENETDEELLRNYEETLIDSLRYLDSFPDNFVAILDTIYKRVINE